MDVEKTGCKGIPSKDGFSGSPPWRIGPQKTYILLVIVSPAWPYTGDNCMVSKFTHSYPLLRANHVRVRGYLIYNSRLNVKGKQSRPAEDLVEEAKQIQNL